MYNLETAYTVKEIIEALSKMPQEAKCVVYYEGTCQNTSLPYYDKDDNLVITESCG